MTSAGPEAELIAVVREWDGAMLRNDANEIGSYMADDWIIIGSDGRTIDKTRFLEAIISGELTHEVMTSENIQVRRYGDAAIVIASGVSAGQFRGHPFREVERQSNVFIREGSRWRCVLTHLSRLSP
ncbi:MAG TPA: nuclear transport factor 2 family protein [Gemmatimonadales bacterium]|nr:nuclear transport factor 2 family protein [Gemmatimonadales bacterium]